MANKYRDYDNYIKEYPDAQGYFGKYGGAYIPPQLENAFKEINEAYATIAQSAKFINELRRIRKEFQGRPTPVYHCERMSNYLGQTQISTRVVPTNSTIAWAKLYWPNIWAKRKSSPRPAPDNMA